jgi:hypothetical protein
MIDRKAIKALADKKSGHSQLEEFLLEIEPQVRAMIDAIDRMNAMFDAESDPVLTLPAIAAGIGWFQLREAAQLFKFAADARIRAVQQRTIAEQRIATSQNRKVDARHRALLHRLNEALETLTDFAEAYPKAMNWIQNLKGPLANHFKNGLGSFTVDTSI